MLDVYKNIESYNLNKKKKVLIVSDNMIEVEKLIFLLISEIFIFPNISKLILEVENLIFLLSLLHNLILKCQMMLD